MPDNDLNAPPKRSRGDVAHALAKAAISGIPAVGGSAADLFGLVRAPPIERRRDQWFEKLHERLKEVEQREGLKLEDLFTNEGFVSANLKAARIALSTHEEEKLEALRNAVLNVICDRSPDEETQAFFFQLIEPFTVTHIQVLRLFADGSSFPPQRRRELENRRNLTDPVVLELNARGLVEDPRPFAARNRESDQPLVSHSWTLSPLGRQFL